MQITKCRSCKESVSPTAVDLGEMSNTGYFPASDKEEVIRARLNLVYCLNCELVQLGENIDSNWVFTSGSYGYNSSLNGSMVENLRSISLLISSLLCDIPKAKVLDIGCNDGTLLKLCLQQRSDIVAVGVDPSLESWIHNFPPGVTPIPEFFSGNLCEEIGIGKFDLVTTIAMFYDLPNPLDFAQDIYNSLSENGLWIMEQSYLPTMIMQNSFDTICHEHLEYYSLKSLLFIFDYVGFVVLKLEFNYANGGSIRLILKKRTTNETKHHPDVDIVLEKENQFLKSDLEMNSFMDRILDIQNLLQSEVRRIQEDQKIIVGLGASTKGNTLLQFCRFTKRELPYIEEINPIKRGRFTPGSKIPISMADELIESKPNFKLVLPWHFRQTIKTNQSDFVRDGGRLIFPLPDFQIV